MKRISVMVLAILFSAALCMGAAASRNHDLAADLAAVGMFRGTSKGFELDRAPTRSEAAIMLVRLYGAEETAKTDYDAGKIAHPFTDVSAFSSPYVAWLYVNGITKGTSATTFSASNSCTRTNYAAFLLRALGYQDGVDFQYANALAFAAEKGIDTAVPVSGTFLRDDLVFLTYQALAADLKNGGTYMLDSLIQSGAIDAAAAAPLKEKIVSLRNSGKGTAGTVSIDPKDYGITEAMLQLLDGQTPDFSKLPLEALGAYYLHTDGAGAESAAYWLYQRFLAAPDTVLNYLAALGEQKARSNADKQTTAAQEICRAIAMEDAYEPSEQFTAILETCQTAHPDGPLADVLKYLRTEYDAAIERNHAGQT